LEINLSPKRSVADFTQLDDAQSDLFAPIAKEILARLDGVFGIKMAYIASWYQAPVRSGRDSMRLHWQTVFCAQTTRKIEVAIWIRIWNGCLYYGFRARAIC
jgi:UDPglucose--hexose-1-phosphate uridylyltransferase